MIRAHRPASEWTGPHPELQEESAVKELQTNGDSADSHVWLDYYFSGNAWEYTLNNSSIELASNWLLLLENIIRGGGLENTHKQQRPT